MDTAIISKNEILKAYKQFVLLKGRQPNSVTELAAENDFEDADFYKYYRSVSDLEKEIWKGYFVEVDEILRSDEKYAAFSAYEKQLSLLYTLIQILEKDRSYVMYKFGKKIPAIDMKPFNRARQKALETGKEWLKDFPAWGDDRKISLKSFYEEAFWKQILFVIKFWADDDSGEGKNTDALIEKSTRLFFELLDRGPVDAVLDFGKFLWQIRNSGS